jgi:hypothetical protein
MVVVVVVMAVDVYVSVCGGRGGGGRSNRWAAQKKRVVTSTVQMRMHVPPRCHQSSQTHPFAHDVSLSVSRYDSDAKNVTYWSERHPDPDGRLNMAYWSDNNHSQVMQSN